MPNDFVATPYSKHFVLIEHPLHVFFAWLVVTISCLVIGHSGNHHLVGWFLQFALLKSGVIGQVSG
jgi:hypothetical protein